MPMNPATPDRTAPIANPIAGIVPSVAATMTATITPTMAIAVYWRLR